MKRIGLLLALVGLPLFAQAAPARHTFAIGETDFLLDGKPIQIRCGEVHAMRVPREYWRHRLEMVKAMGLNTVCAYLFWNVHEPRPGEFDWSGQADAAEFCRIAQEVGLWVILRPGPYACAEWEMGGMPWWLLKDPQMELRSRHPGFMDPARRYLREVGRVLGPLQVSHGGPILMVQVENEYGYYSNDAAYMREMRQAVLDAGFDVPLFACNPTARIRDGFIPELFQVVNFATDPAGGFKALRAVQPKGPLMCGEFYPGWFDTWGAPHHLGNAPRYLADLATMLEAGASFSIYMAHGGTTFGLWSGTDRPFKPDTSSYDYDAPIDETGAATDKFFKTRELMAKHLGPDETLPAPPPAKPKLTFAPVKAAAFAPLFGNLPAAIASDAPSNFEAFDLARGCAVYRTTLPAGAAGTLSAAAVGDFGFVFLNGRRIGAMDRRLRHFSVEIPARREPATLDILVEAVGRINFGHESHDRKGLLGPVRLGTTAADAKEVTGWRTFPFPLTSAMLADLRYAPVPSTGAAPGAPGFWRASVELRSPADTFLDLRAWGKGVVWVNGHCIGRFWNIGPTQTMYVPAPWLRAGTNEIVVLDLLGPTQPVLAGLDHPILAELRPKLDFARDLRRRGVPALDGVTPVQSGEFAPGDATQDIRFATGARGRYFCLETVDSQDGRPDAAVAEIALLNNRGEPMPLDGWVVVYADSEAQDEEDGSAENALDGQAATAWHATGGGHPHRLLIDLGQTRNVTGLRYTPRQGANAAGRINGYRVYLGDNLLQQP